LLGDIITRRLVICAVLGVVMVSVVAHAHADQASLDRPDTPPLSPTRLAEAKQAPEIKQAITLAKTMGYHHLKDAAALLRPLADAGNPVAQMELASVYASPGSATVSDPKTAMLLYKQSAAQGYAPAEVALGKAYRLGQGVEVDKGEATYWYRQAAQQKDPVGEALYGVALLLGDGCKKDMQAGSALLDEAARTDPALGLMVPLLKPQLTEAGSQSADGVDNLAVMTAQIFQ